jgi:CDP-diacylglycerol pyrophosphatase
MRTLVVIAIWFLPLSRADVRTCVCDVARPETMAAKECSLCREVETMPSEPQTIFVRDTNPNKPNRWLALPRFHGTNPQQLLDMTAAQRTAYWSAAITKAHEVWGDQWGLAINSLERRTQCHAHIHIGKLLEDSENDHFIVVNGPADIPVERDGDGLWVHPAGDKLHVHTDEPAGELKLQR